MLLIFPTRKTYHLRTLSRICCVHACLFAISSLGAHQTTGKDIDFWLGGNTVYGVCIFVANMILAQHSKTFEWRYIFLLILGPIAYFLFYWIANVVLVNEVWHLFRNNFSITVIWYAIIFTMIFIYALDKVRHIYEDFDEIEDNLPGAIQWKKTKMIIRIQITQSSM